MGMKAPNRPFGLSNSKALPKVLDTRWLSEGYKLGTPDLYPLLKSVSDYSPRFVGLAARLRAATRSIRRAGGLRSCLAAAMLGCRHGVGRLRRAVARASNHFRSTCWRAPSDKAGAEHRQKITPEHQHNSSGEDTHTYKCGLSAVRISGGQGASGRRLLNCPYLGGIFPVG